MKFDAIVDDANKYCINAGNIGRVCEGKRKTCGGYHWRYLQGGDIKSMAAYKTCKKCGRAFPMTPIYFNKNETSKDGFQSYCRS